MEPMAYIGAGMCALSMTAAAWGVSQVWTTIIFVNDCRCLGCFSGMDNNHLHRRTQSAGKKRC